MTAWWHARLGWLYCIVVIATAATAYALWPTGLFMPNLVLASTNSFSIAYVLAFLPGLTWITLIEIRAYNPELVTTRRFQIATLDYTTAVGAPALVGLAFIWFGLPTLQGAGRNFLLATALSLVALNVLPRYFAFLLPVGYLIAAATTGFSRSEHAPDYWALLLSRWDPERDIPIILIALAIALTVHFGRERLTTR